MMTLVCFCYCLFFPDPSSVWRCFIALGLSRDHTVGRLSMGGDSFWWKDRSFRRWFPPGRWDLGGARLSPLLPFFSRCFFDLAGERLLVLSVRSQNSFDSPLLTPVPTKFSSVLASRDVVSLSGSGWFFFPTVVIFPAARYSLPLLRSRQSCPPSDLIFKRATSLTPSLSPKAPFPVDQKKA